jgi:hypothetical protein
MYRGNAASKVVAIKRDVAGQAQRFGLRRRIPHIAMAARRGPQGASICSTTGGLSPDAFRPLKAQHEIIESWPPESRVVN